MKILRNVVLILIVFVNLSACNQQQDASTEQWQTDEVLSHLVELRKEVVSLRKEISALKEDVAKITSSGRRQPAQISISLNDQFSMGDDTAELAIVEFSDYQCPYCARHAKQVYPKLKKNFVETGKVKYFIRNFPLNFHAQARNAAIVSECAGKQGQLWPVHEYLFQNSRQLGEATFDNVVTKFGLNKEQFDSCRKDKSVVDKINADMLLGQRNGVSGTPKFFIGRIKNNKLIDVIPLSGAQPYVVFERIIKSLEKKL